MYRHDVHFWCLVHFFCPLSFISPLAPSPVAISLTGDQPKLAVPPPPAIDQDSRPAMLASTLQKGARSCVLVLSLYGVAITRTSELPLFCIRIQQPHVNVDITKYITVLYFMILRS